MNHRVEQVVGGGLYRGKGLGTVLSLACVLAVAPALAAPDVGDSLPLSIRGDFSARVLIDNLDNPRGLAVHPTSGELYVAETESGTISVVRDGERVSVIESGFRVEPSIPKWALREGANEAHWREPLLRRPINLAFAEDGRLFVVEDASSGRLLEFTPDRLGRYNRARVIPIPWLAKEFNWEGLTVAKDGRLFIAGSVANAGPGLLFGSVLMRDQEEAWWVIDYGPFSGFSSLCLSKHEDILVVGDRAGGGVTWWDTKRHKVIGTSEAPLPNPGSVDLLRDGTIVVAQPSPEDMLQAGLAPSPPGRLMRVNPETLEQELLASGFGEITDLAYAHDAQCLYVSDARSGSIYELKSTDQGGRTDYYLRRSLYRFEMSQGMAPRQWPKFMEDFVSRLGVQTSNELTDEDGKDIPDSEEMVFSVREFTDRIPMIAGRVKVISDSLRSEDQDPVSQVDFVVFYPGKSVVSGGNATPSLSLFSATHASGKVERTRAMQGFTSHTRRGHDWDRRSENAILYFPMASCTTQRERDGVELTLAFLGMGHLNDYYLKLECGKVDQGHLMVEGESGKLADYDVEFTELDDEGDEVRNIMIAGFDPEESDDYTWLHIGKEPVDTQLRFDEQANGSWISYRLAAFKPLIEEKDREMRMVQWDTRGEQRMVNTPDGTPMAEQNVSPLLDNHADSIDHGEEGPRQTRAPGTEGHANAPFPPSADQDMSDIRPEEADDVAALSWTNLMLTRAIDTWQTQDF